MPNIYICFGCVWLVAMCRYYSLLLCVVIFVTTSRPAPTCCLLTGDRLDSRRLYLHKVEISQLYANSEAEPGSAAAGSAPQAIPACFARRIARVPYKVNGGGQSRAIIRVQWALDIRGQK